MKIEELAVQHFYNCKELSLSGLGFFRLHAGSIPAQETSDGCFQVDKSIIEFRYDPHAPADFSLLNFVIQQTGKMSALASADIETYIELAKQFLNIGKSFTIDGIGTLLKNQRGEYSFIQQEGVASSPGALELAKDTHPETQQPKLYKKIQDLLLQKNIRIGIALLAAILVVTILTFALGGNSNTPSAEATFPIVDTTVTSLTADHPHPSAITMKATRKDTLAETTPRPMPAIKDSSYTFKVIIKVYPTIDSIRNAYRRLTADGFKKLTIYSAGDKYQLGIPFMHPLSDTTRLRDSIHLIFGGKTRIELPQS